MASLHFSSWSAFFAMGGYGLFVWISFGSSLLLLALLWWFSQRSHRQLFAQLAAKQAREQRIAQHHQEQHKTGQTLVQEQSQ